MSDSAQDPIARRMAEVKQRLSDLQARLPAHSIPPTMMMEMESLEEELERLQRQLEKRRE
jgi:hypothetical protein